MSADSPSQPPRRPNDPDATERTAVQDAAALARSGELSRGGPVAAGYALREQIGRGSYGEVWLARDEASGADVAIKFFHHGAGPRWEGVQNEVGRLNELRG